MKKLLIILSVVTALTSPAIAKTPSEGVKCQFADSGTPKRAELLAQKTVTIEKKSEMAGKAQAAN